MKSGKWMESRTGRPLLWLQWEHFLLLGGFGPPLFFFFSSRNRKGNTTDHKINTLFLDDEEQGTDARKGEIPIIRFFFSLFTVLLSALLFPIFPKKKKIYKNVCIVLPHHDFFSYKSSFNQTAYKYP